MLKNSHPGVPPVNTITSCTDYGHVPGLLMARPHFMTRPGLLPRVPDTSRRRQIRDYVEVCHALR